MNRYTSVRFLETDNLFSWDGIAVRAATESRLLQLGKVALQEALGLVSNNNVIPLHERNNTLLGEDFHHVTAMQHRLDGSELAIDTCIMGMLSDMTVNLKSKVER